jgi:hypothetical protein
MSQVHEPVPELEEVLEAKYQSLLPPPAKIEDIRARRDKFERWGHRGG